MFRGTLVMVVAAAALVTGACSNMPGWADIKLPSASTFVPTSANTFNEATLNTTRSVSSADLVDAQGACGAPGQPSGRGVSLEMTECQVVQALGAPEATDIASNEHGERAVTMTYLGTERAGLYRFVRGRLVSVERAPGSPEPQRPAKQPPKKPATKPGPA